MITVLITALGVVLAAAIAGGSVIVVQLLQRPSKTTAYESRLERRDEKIAELQDDNEKYYITLKACQEEVRCLKQKLYDEQVGHRIAERKLAAALERLGEADD